MRIMPLPGVLVPLLRAITELNYSFNSQKILRTVYPIYPDNYRDKGNKIQLIVIMKFIFAANR